MWQLRFSTPPPKEKKPRNLEWGWGLSSLSGWGESKAGHVGFFKCFSFNKSSHLLLFYLFVCARKENGFFFFSSCSGASSQFNNIKHINMVYLICGMVREKKKMTLFNIDLLCGKLEHFSYLGCSIVEHMLSLCTYYTVHSYLLKKILIFERSWKEVVLQVQAHITQTQTSSTLLPR